MEKEIAKHIVEAKSSKVKKIKIILGDIYEISDIPHPTKLFYKSKNLNEDEHDKLWHNYEKVRFITSNECPSFIYFAIHKLCEQGIVDSIITTNYDQYLESIYEKCSSNFQLIRNPILPPDSYDWEGYYSSSKIDEKNFVKYFKIHGSFSHVIFLNCNSEQPHIFKLPNFLTAFSTKKLRSKLKGNFFHFNINHFLDSKSEQCKETGYYIHYIDWQLKNREAFQKEISASIKDLKNVKNTVMILSLGFTGRHDEELNSHLLDLVKHGIPVYYIISESQMSRIKPRGDYLYHQLQKLVPKNIVCYESPVDFMMGVLQESGEKVNNLLAEYRTNWQLSDIFIPTSQIGGYMK